LKKLLAATFLAMLVLLSVILSKPVSAPVPIVQNVVAYDVGGSTFLNITVWHNIEIASHYIDVIRVVLSGNTTDLQIGVQPLTPSGTFNITYPLGQISGSPTITVDAHCTVNGWASSLEHQWTGQIPEFPTPVLMLAMALTASLAALVLRKAKSQFRK
jgi:hypothetical protein